MKILGKSKIKPKAETVPLGVAEDGQRIDVIMTGPPLGYLEQLDEELPDPTPPQVVMRDPRTKEVLKDDDDRPITVGNVDDPVYLKQRGRINRAKTMALLLKCLGDQVEVKAQHNGDPVGYYESVFQELEQAGVGLAAFKRLASASLRVSGLGVDEVDQARELLLETLPEGG